MEENKKRITQFKGEKLVTELGKQTAGKMFIIGKSNLKPVVK